MAEAAVKFAIQNLTPLLVEEIKLLGGLKNEVQNIKTELESLRYFLKDADARAAVEELEGETSKESVRKWVKQLREEAYRIEDVMDEYALTAANIPQGSGLLCCLEEICCLIEELKLRHRVATEIKDIKSSLADIKKRGESHGFRSIDEGSSSGTRNVLPHDPRVGAFFLEDDEVVGIESTRDKLVDLLINGRSQRSIIAVVGEGGLGKTTLAGKIFNNQDVRNHFQCRAWFTVGKEYNKQDLLRMIIKEVHLVAGQSAPTEIYNMEERDLIILLREQLKDKTYMVVFDDVWKVDFWGDVEHALLDNKNGSRIFVTTRRMNVAEFCRRSSFVEIHELETLSPNDAWKLFCRKAFGPSSESYCPSQLKDLSHEILSKCRGLPLAIIAVGGLLSTKNKAVSEWQKLLNGLGSKLGSDPHLKDCNRVLSEGYYDLPHHLKSCLLYFGLFPESDEISCAKLMRLWIAEGFVHYNEHLTSEQVAEEYLNELIDRSLVQVSKRDVSERAKFCQVHDLMYEIIVRKTKEMGFCCFVNEDGLSHYGKTRRISIYGSTEDISESSLKDSKVRSILFFNIDNMPDSFMSTMIAEFKLIKVLDFEDAPINYLPEGVGNLFHLHYLSVRNTTVEVVPKSIGKLVNLETFDLRGSLVIELPAEIRNLKKLRFLRVYKSGSKFMRLACVLQDGLGSLRELQKLSVVQVNSQMIEELRKLRQLKKLGVCLTEGNGNDLSSLIADMENLESLIVCMPSKEEILDIPSLASPPQYLQRLELAGKMEKLPDWMFQLENLTRISLILSGLIDDPLVVLQSLPNLLVLRLCDTHKYESFHFKEGWFQQLRELVLSEYEAVKHVIIEKGALPNLRDFYIQYLPSLEEIPAGIEHLTKLKYLLFVDMLRQVCYMMKDENWDKVTHHIPEIRVEFPNAGQFFNSTTKYLSSLSPNELEQLMEESESNNEQ